MAESLASFVSKTTTLSELNLSATTPTVPMLETILLAINSELSLSLDLSYNNLGVNGAKMIAKNAYKIASVSSLNLTENGLGEDGIGDLCIGLINNFSIKTLYLDRNWKGNASFRGLAIKNLIKLVSSDSVVESLHLSTKGGSGSLKQDIIPFLNCLATNKSILQLDISGHHIGNNGAIALAKMLQVNNSLTHFTFDENLIGLIGFRNIKYALAINKTLKHLVLPISDIAEVLQHESSAVEQRKLQNTLNKIEKLVQRNQARRSNQQIQKS